MPARMHVHEVVVDETLVRRLLHAQMPECAELPLLAVEPWGTDNAIWRLGRDLVVRLPRIAAARDQPGHEAMWLPLLAPHLRLRIPRPVALGVPGEGYPFPWAVHQWIPGRPAETSPLDRQVFARQLAQFVRELQAIPTGDAPPPMNRARPLREYDGSAREVIAGAAHLVDAGAALDVWDAALAAAPHDGDALWVHGDLEGNCLVDDGRLAGVVDWSLMCAGDPAVDVQVVWSPLFDGDSRREFLELLDIDEATVIRSRGAAVQQACAAIPYYQHTYPLMVERSRHKLRTLGVACR